MSDSFKERNVNGLLHPASEEERTISNLLSELGRVADRFKDDSVMLTGVVQPLGSSIIGLLNGEVGRLDQSSIDTKVREIVKEAGGNDENL